MIYQSFDDDSLCARDPLVETAANAVAPTGLILAEAVEEDDVDSPHLWSHGADFDLSYYYYSQTTSL